MSPGYHTRSHCLLLAEFVKTVNKGVLKAQTNVLQQRVILAGSVAKGIGVEDKLTEFKLTKDLAVMVSEEIVYAWQTIALHSCGEVLTDPKRRTKAGADAMQAAVGKLNIAIPGSILKALKAIR